MNQPSAMSSTSLELCLRLTRAWAVLTRRLDSKLSSVHGLSFSDFMVLHSLSRAEGSRLRRIDLAERMGLTASGVTRTLLPLEKIGLVGRESDPRDARVGYATLTPAGQELHGYALASAEVICQDATQAVSGEQLAVVVELLGGLAGINAANA
jgi:DNA-binding MarR family transcriptional regulator